MTRFAVHRIALTMRQRRCMALGSTSRSNSPALRKFWKLGGFDGSRESSALRKQSVNVLACDFIAFASLFFETGAIYDVNASVMRVDESGIMKVAYHPRNCCSLHAKHLTEKLVSERNRVALGSIASLQ